VCGGRPPVVGMIQIARRPILLGPKIANEAQQLDNEIGRAENFREIHDCSGLIGSPERMSTHPGTASGTGIRIRPGRRRGPHARWSTKG
jgi:hypothetical protein